jgi:hypothetical protein
MSYREIFTAAETDPGEVFYTITREDVGKTTIVTTAGPIRMIEILGRVQAGDVGKRVYRMPCDDPAAGWVWQAENDAQRDERLAAS